MRGSFKRAYRRGGARRPVVKHERQSAGRPADPHVETTAIRQLNLLKRGHPAILPSRRDPCVRIQASLAAGHMFGAAR
jgi:hypothetical protein